MDSIKSKIGNITRIYLFIVVPYCFSKVDKCLSVIFNKKGTKHNSDCDLHYKHFKFAKIDFFVCLGFLFDFVLGFIFVFLGTSK